MTIRRHTRTGLAAAILALSIAGVACGGNDGASAGETSFTPPKAIVGENGWEEFPDAPRIDAAAARGLNPAADSPEAAVVKFLASRARGDGAWEEAMVASPSDRAQRALAEWEEWDLRSFQLRGKKATGANSYYVKTFFEIAVGDDTDEGEDEFEVVREGDGWRVAGIPA